jgi:hypothetical protein
MKYTVRVVMQVSNVCAAFCRNRAGFPAYNTIGGTAPTIRTQCSGFQPCCRRTQSNNTQVAPQTWASAREWFSGQGVQTRFQPSELSHVCTF